jgi:hypothetical protein
MGTERATSDLRITSLSPAPRGEATRPDRHWGRGVLMAVIDGCCGPSGGTSGAPSAPVDPSIPVRRPDAFRSVRDLGGAALRCQRESGQLRGRSFRWLPAWLPSRRCGYQGGHHDAYCDLTAGRGESLPIRPARYPARRPVRSSVDVAGG